MAWNEPGGGNKDDKDPWGNRDDQGPPDLDEAFKKLQNNLSDMFGGKKSSGGGGGSSAKMNFSMLGLGLVGALLVWFLMGVYQIDEQERGVVLRFGKAMDEIVMPGLHWNPPIIDQVMKENVTRVRDIRIDSEMLTEDENIVKVVNMTVQYVISDVKKYLLRVRNPDESLYQATESALRHEVGSSEMNDVLTEGRADLGDRVQQRIQEYMNRYNTGIAVSKVNIDETAPPDAVRAAFDDVIKAKEDEVRVRNEANAYANQIIPEARGAARRLLEEAEAYKQRVISQSKGEASRFNQLYAEYKLAPEVTRERLYIDTLESVMSNSTKIMIDVEGGNNLLYLPLDKIMESSGTGRNSGQDFGGSNSSNVQQDGSFNNRSTSRRDRN